MTKEEVERLTGYIMNGKTVDEVNDFTTLIIKDRQENGTDIIARLSRKLQKAKSQNTALRKYAQHYSYCKGGDKCICGLEELLKPKKQNPI